jgi:hypothetical protein
LLAEICVFSQKAAGKEKLENNIRKCHFETWLSEPRVAPQTPQLPGLIVSRQEVTTAALRGRAFL